MRTIRLTADYECWPLWEPGAGGDPYPTEPESLSLSVLLREQLWSWAAVYDATLNRADPASSRWSLETECQKFIRDGSALQRQLQDEFGDDFEVRYFDSS